MDARNYGVFFSSPQDCQKAQYAKLFSDRRTTLVRRFFHTSRCVNSLHYEKFCPKFFIVICITRDSDSLGEISEMFDYYFNVHRIVMVGIQYCTPSRYFLS